MNTVRDYEHRNQIQTDKESEELLVLTCVVLNPASNGKAFIELLLFIDIGTAAMGIQK